ncbi:MAG: hypothetical protein H6654_07370 [Ardenticatenaceae bacterium]|nr:hypothetical protein [Anaerolineales bacterium]MCB8940345.1 hypothetical protein [Ardenticatenaceae bacterium]MCB8973361.1 hypothetical protein [Ardenticatenaceae bacterium]
MFVLRGCEIEKVIRVKVERQPDENDDRKGDKARAVSHRCKKGQQEYPKCRIVNPPNDCEWMRGCLFDSNMVI